MTNNNSQYSFESTDLILYLWKRKIPLIIITVSAAIISILVSFAITPKFRSTVILFPASQSPVSKSLLQANYQDRVGILGFGDEDQLERILQVLHSDNIRDQIISKYDLMNHYDIDPLGHFPRTKLYAEYSSNITFKRTEFNSIVIEVMDPDPQMAADIGNDIAALVDSTMNSMKQDRAQTAFELVEREYIQCRDRVKELNDSISFYNKKGVISYDRQIERYTEAYGKAIAEGNFGAVDRLDKIMKEFMKYTGPLTYYWELRANETLRLRDLTAKYIEARAETELALSHIFVLDKAFKAEKKAYPKKSIIVMVSTFASFILAVILFLFFESFLSKIRTQE
ncbi:Wzz/FepE/Etk N-terminal domain-containing protein [Bacteroidota bacterium]